MGAGLAEPDAVFLGMVPVVPFVRVVVVVVVTDKRVRGVVAPLTVLALDGLRCGMREGVVSSIVNLKITHYMFISSYQKNKYIPVLSKDNVEPCLDGGFEPCRLRGRELGLEPAREPPGVYPVLVLVYVTLRGV